MYRYSERSLYRLGSCHPDLIAFARAAIAPQVYDITVLWGHRNEPQQAALFKAGRSKVKWPDSRHNKTPSEALDLAPYPLPDWDDGEAWLKFVWYLKGIAARMGLALEFGADWRDKPRDGKPGWDAPHVQLAEPRELDVLERQMAVHGVGLLLGREGDRAAV